MATSPMSAAGRNLVDILREDHLKIDELFGRYGNTDDDAEKLAIVENIYLDLLPHAKAEEEIVYPAVRDAGDDEAFIEDLYDEQAAAEKTIESILRSEPDDLTFDMKVKMLQKSIQQHVREEETVMVQQMQDAGLDLTDLGRRFEQRRTELRPDFARQLLVFRAR